MPEETSAPVEATSTQNTTAPVAQANSGEANASMDCHGSNEPRNDGSINQNGSNENTDTVIEGADFNADELRAEMQKMMNVDEAGSEQQKESTTQENNVETQQQEEDGEAPVYRDSDGREVIQEIYIDELQRNVTLDELLDKFKGFDYYHQNALKQQQDANAIKEAYSQLQQQKAEFEAQKQEYENLKNLKNDPAYKIVQMLNGDIQLKREVLNLVSRLRPGGFKKIQIQQQAEARKLKFEEMQKKINNLENIEQQRANLFQQQQQNNLINKTSEAIQNHVNNKVKELSDLGIQISNEELTAISNSCVPLIKAYGYNYEIIAKQFDSYFNMIASKSKQMVNNYQNAKRNAPPAPPSGGASPTIRPTPIQNDDDFEAMAASFLAKQLGM